MYLHYLLNFIDTSHICLGPKKVSQILSLPSSSTYNIFQNSPESSKKNV